MPYKMLTPVTPELELALPPLRWRRGQFVDIDPEYLPALVALTGVEEVSREEAAEVITDKPLSRKAAAEKAREEKAGEPSVG